MLLHLEHGWYTIEILTTNNQPMNEESYNEQYDLMRELETEGRESMEYAYPEREDDN